MTKQTEVAILGGGCFWCLEAVYLEVRGVTRSSPATWAGTSPIPPTSRCAPAPPATPKWCGSSSIRQQVSYRDILEVFFTIHDPTTLNRQGNDVGTQYRSAIFTIRPSRRAWRAR